MDEQKLDDSMGRIRGEFLCENDPEYRDQIDVVFDQVERMVDDGDMDAARAAFKTIDDFFNDTESSGGLDSIPASQWMRFRLLQEVLDETR